MREMMAELGFRTLDELIGQKQYITLNNRKEAHWKAKYLDFSNMLYTDDFYKAQTQICTKTQNHKLEETLDYRAILAQIKPALDTGQKVTGTFEVRNIDRAVGTITGSLVSHKYGAEGLPEDTIDLTFKGAAGQSFGAYTPKGMTLRIIGDANDYFGKGLSGGKLIVAPGEETPIDPHDSAVVGNVTLYGATGGEAYMLGKAGARFAVRNSGATAVVEGIGDNGCEYMTGGAVAILGEVGDNFAAGMSGGVAYVYTKDKEAFSKKTNHELVSVRGVVSLREKKSFEGYVDSPRRLYGE